MPADLYLDWGGDLSFGPSNDLRLATDVAYANQRVVRRLLTGPEQRDRAGNVVQPADNLFEPLYGAGLNRDIDGNMSAAATAEKRTRINSAMHREPAVDQTKPIELDFVSDPATNIEYAIVKYTTTDDLNGIVGVQS